MIEVQMVSPKMKKEEWRVGEGKAGKEKYRQRGFGNSEHQSERCQGSILSVSLLQSHHYLHRNWTMCHTML